MLGGLMRGWIAGLVLILTSPVWAADCVVTDGDTLTCDGTKFRLHGIDAPELNPNQICLDEKGKEWKCGVAARDALAKLISCRKRKIAHAALHQPALLLGRLDPQIAWGAANRLADRLTSR